MKYQSELIKEIVDSRGHKESSLHYESECTETWIKEAKGAYPKLCDYESEWLNYISVLDDTGGEDPKPPIGEFPYVVLSDVTEATVDNVVPYAYKSAVLKGQSLVNLFDISTSDRKDSLVTVLVDVNKVTVKGTWFTSFRMNLKPSTKYTLFVEFETEGRIIVIGDYTNANGQTLLNLQVQSAGTKGIYTFTSNDNGSMNGLLLYASNKNAVYKNIMVLEGDMSNEDVHYFTGIQSCKMPVLTTSNEDGTKTIMLTVNEDVTLRSNGNVCDELDLLTGKLTQRIDEDGSALTQEVVRTVDLNIQDQNGKTLSVIKPIEGKMFLSTSSNTIKPLFSGEIPVEAITQNLASFIDLD